MTDSMYNLYHSPERSVHLDDKGTSAYTTSPVDIEQEETDIM